MRQRSTFGVLHLLFTAGTFLIAGSFFGFLAYLYVAFNGPLTGDVRVTLTPELLANLQAKRFETAVDHMEKRMSMPDVPPDLPDPFDARR